MAEQTFTEQHEQTLARVRNRRAERDASKPVPTSGKGKESEILPITEAAATGQGEDIQVTQGDADTAPFRLMLRAPVISKAKTLQVKLFELFPDAFVAAAAGDPQGVGINREKAAEVLKKGADVIVETNKDAVPITLEEAREAIDFGISEFYQDIADYDPAQPNPAAKIEQIADCVWSLAGGHNDGLTREKLPALLMDNLTPEAFADLLRAILRCIRGSNTSYENDIHSRFLPA